MSDVKHHTPGVWRANQETYAVNPDGETDDPAHVVYVYRPDQPRIAVYAGYVDNCWADARLVAAAPDLLDACEAVLDYFDDASAPGATSRQNRLLRRVEAALARVRG